jgi:acetyl-CoA carboxylase biotin carboxyl carrier protein
MKRKQSSSPKATPSLASPEIEQIEQLIRFMDQHNLEEFEFSRADVRIRLRKPSSAPVVATAVPVGMPERAAAAMTTGAPAAAAVAPVNPVAGEPPADEDLHLVKSPIVGTFYGAPSPGADAFVKIGSHVDVGQTLCIVEAMKLMNEIESDAAGEVVRIFAENGQPVEYGQALFGIRPARKK